MIPYMEKEVALEIVKQFPVYVEFVESAIENYTQLCKTILETNKEEYEQAVHAHQYVLETFANQLEQENLTEEERRGFSEKMMEEADKYNGIIFTAAEISGASVQDDWGSCNISFGSDGNNVRFKSNW